jgi:hypothetical protein
MGNEMTSFYFFLRGKKKSIKHFVLTKTISFRSVGSVTESAFGIKFYTDYRIEISW